MIKNNKITRENNMEQRKLMVVDNDLDTLVILSTVFEIEGMEIVPVDDLRKCLTELERGLEGVILIDIMMPYVDGWAIIRNIIREGFMENNRLIILTAEKYPDEKMDEFNEYIDDYITKPFEVRYLVSSVKRSFERLEKIKKQQFA